MSFISSISELQIPGSFVVLQGLPGDGLVNTMDSLPEWTMEEDAATSRSNETSPMAPSSLPLNLIGTAMRSNGRFFTTMNNSKSVAADRRIHAQEESSSLQGFVVVDDKDEASSTRPPSSADSTRPPSSTRTISTRQQEAILKWKDDCWKQQCLQFQDWQETCHANQRAASPPRHDEIQSLSSSLSSSSSSSNSSSSRGIPNAWWLARRGFLAVLEDLPQPYGPPPKAMDMLAPGMTVVATELITMDSEDFTPIPVHPREEVDDGLVYPPGKRGEMQILRMEWNSHPSKQGYVVLSRNGYPFLGPGLPAAYTDPDQWIWRVTCPDGAFVRAGMDLSSTHMGTVPYGSLVLVRRKLVNGMGLSRLQVSAAISKKLGNQTLVETMDGWCSEFLNPLSGQRGCILQPLPFPLPALYRIDLQPSATIRSGIELSSPEIGFASYGVLVTVTGRAFSEHPAEKCIERLRLAGNGGWISLRLNKHPPHDSLIAVHEGLDPSFDPDQPALFHVEEMRKIQTTQTAVNVTSSSVPIISSVDDEDISSASFTSSSDSSEQEAVRSAPTPVSHLGCTYTQRNVSSPLAPSALSKQMEAQRKDEFCVICLTEDRNATMVHGSTGHIACCLMCARILKARKDPCPVCRLPIDLVIQHFYA